VPGQIALSRLKIRSLSPGLAKQSQQMPLIMATVVAAVNGTAMVNLAGRSWSLNSRSQSMQIGRLPSGNDLMLHTQPASACPMVHDMSRPTSSRSDSIDQGVIANVKT
jgi:hypothetical protein